jgi:hypothetical protein
MRPTTAPCLNLQDQSPAAVIAGNASEAARSAKRVKTSPAAVEFAPESPNAASGMNLGFGTPIRSLGRRMSSSAVHDDAAASAAAVVPNRISALSSPPLSSARKNKPRIAKANAEQDEPYREPIDLTTKASPERARVRKYSILHPHVALSSAAVDISENSTYAQSPQFDNHQFDAHTDSGVTFVPRDTSGSQQWQQAYPRAGWSAQGADEIASVFLEVVHASSMLDSQSCAGQQTIDVIPSRHVALKDHASKENKDSKRQLAAIIKNKALLQQPLEEYNTARFAQRMQLCAAL